MSDISSVSDLFQEQFPEQSGVLITVQDSIHKNQTQTNAAFSDKWVSYGKEEVTEQERLFEFGKNWYLDLYGFSDEADLRAFLQQQDVVLDAGCGIGYKAKWFAELSPSTHVIAMDFSDAVFVAAEKFSDTPNLSFVKGDIADTKIADGSISYVSCDQVIHHTENPLQTMRELSRILRPEGQLAVYVYAKKALPRELLDDYFREGTKSISQADMWKLSEQLTELGKRLSELNVSIDVPDIPLLDIKGGSMDLQRFIYWNFLKCFWNPELGEKTSTTINYDWYAPSNAERYSKQEFLAMSEACGLGVTVLHSEEACYSGRFFLK